MLVLVLVEVDGVKVGGGRSVARAVVASVLLVAAVRWWQRVLFVEGTAIRTFLLVSVLVVRDVGGVAAAVAAAVAVAAAAAPARWLWLCTPPPPPPRRPRPGSPLLPSRVLPSRVCDDGSFCRNFGPQEEATLCAPAAGCW